MAVAKDNRLIPKGHIVGMYAGKNTVDYLWEDLQAAMQEVKRLKRAGSPQNRAKGVCEGYARSLARLLGREYDSIRSEAVERFT